MPVPTALSDLSTTAGSNFPQGGESPITADDALRAHASFLALLRDGKGASAEVTVASAGTADIGAAASPFVLISGTTTITSFGTTYSGARFVRFSGILTLTHNATTLILPGGANIATAAGDSCLVTPIGSPGSGWKVSLYERAANAPGVVTSATNVSGTVAIANGGTGQTSAAAALAALLGAPLASPALTGAPTAPTAAYGTNTTQIATTAHALAAAKGTYSLGATSGYVVFANGFTVQYGVSSAGTSGTETYPTPFANSCTAVVFSNNSTNNAGYVTAKSASSFSWSCGGSTTINWIAVGY